ncbi:hypothetical protein [Paracoccus actinidiae]|jgi:hypothetical protein|uniref:hypothetical protein n=1 Tax=Paracoccus actinidiae TaxID=3064531 RepID=UPI0027D26D2C|nr:hypothetical protein [Paracoccus sp. M09]
MKPRHREILRGIEQAIISGDAAQALARIETLARRFDRDGLDAESKAQIEPVLHHLRRLAEDSARGTQRAIDQIRDIVKNARSLQTYDQAGQRRNTSTNAMLAQRF